MVPRWFRHFRLEVKGDTLQVPRLVFRRMRVVMVLSLIANGVLLWTCARVSGNAQRTRVVFQHTSALALAAKDLTARYGDQIEDLTAAYGAYAASLNAAKADRANHYGTYQHHLNRFNQRAQELTELSRCMRDHASRLARHIPNLEDPP